MAINGVNVGQELLNVPMGDMIRSMALAIAEAQWSLDEASMTVAEMMSGFRVLRHPDTGALIDKQGNPLPTGAKPEVSDSRVLFGHTYSTDGKATPNKVSLIELGFVPNFYQFVETIIEVRIAVKMTGSTDNTRRAIDSTNVTSNQTTSLGFASWWNDRELKTGNTAVATVSSVDASYASKYSYSVDSASFLRTKLVPVPPPSILQERIRALIQLEAQRANPPTTPQPTS